VGFAWCAAVFVFAVAPTLEIFSDTRIYPMITLSHARI
jgi:hypothetical protein